MNYTEAFLMGMQKLKEAEIGEAQLDARLLLEEVCGTDHNTLLCHGDREVSEAEEEQYRESVGAESGSCSAAAPFRLSGFHGDCAFR